MGFNTTVVVLNDDLHIIERDPEFGKKLANAIRQTRPNANQKPIGVSARAGNCICANAASVIETHHADQDVLVKVGGNTGNVVTIDSQKLSTLDVYH